MCEVLLLFALLKLVNGFCEIFFFYWWWGVYTKSCQVDLILVHFNPILYVKFKLNFIHFYRN